MTKQKQKRSGNTRKWLIAIAIIIVVVASGVVAVLALMGPVIGSSYMTIATGLGSSLDANYASSQAQQRSSDGVTLQAAQNTNLSDILVRPFSNVPDGTSGDADVQAASQLGVIEDDLVDDVDLDVAATSLPTQSPFPTQTAATQVAMASSQEEPIESVSAATPIPTAIPVNEDVNPFENASEDNLSTFAMDVDTASYSCQRHRHLCT